MPQVGDEIAGGRRRELRELVLRHQRLLGKHPGLDIVERHRHLLGRCLERHARRRLLHHDSGDRSAVVGHHDRRLVVAAHNGARVEQIRQQVFEVSPIRSRQVWPNLSALAMQLVAGATGLCERRPAVREIGLLHGCRVERSPPPLEVSFSVGGGHSDRAPDLVEPRDHLRVGRLGEPADGERRKVATGHRVGSNRVEERERPGGPRRERGDRRLPAVRRQALVGGHERGGRAVAGNGGEAVDRLLLNGGIVHEPLEHGRKPFVSGTDECLQGLEPLAAVSIRVGHQ